MDAGSKISLKYYVIAIMVVNICFLHSNDPRQYLSREKNEKNIIGHAECVLFGCRFKNLAQRKKKQVANVMSFRGLAPLLEPHHPAQHKQSPHKHQVM